MSTSCPLLLGGDLGCFCECDDLGFEVAWQDGWTSYCSKNIHQSALQMTETVSPLRRPPLMHLAYLFSLLS